MTEDKLDTIIKLLEKQNVLLQRLLSGSSQIFNNEPGSNFATPATSNIVNVRAEIERARQEALATAEKARNSIKDKTLTI